MNYRVYTIYKDHERRYAETVELSTAEAVFGTLSASPQTVIELRHCDVAGKWRVIGRKGDLPNLKAKVI